MVAGQRVIIDADRVLLPDGRIAAARLEITDELITAVDERGDHDTAESVADQTITDALVAPGFVDTHVHGGGGGDLASTDVESIRGALAYHRGHGTTSVLAGVVTHELDVILAQLRTLAGLSRSGEIAGIHLETPFLSTAKCGAHPPHLLRHPDPETVEALLEAADGELAMITIAPELPGALDAIRRFVAAGVRVAVGHTAGDVTITRDAIEAGATVATHLFNAMLPIHHREPGPVPLLLTDPRVAVELICDGVHLAPEIVATAIEAAGIDRTILITDAMSAAGLPDGRYRLGTQEVQVAEGRANLIAADGTLGSIAGSTLTLDRAVRFVVDHTARSLPEALTMASTTPARVHGLDAVGRIAPGCRADLVVLDDPVSVTAVMSSGRWVARTEGES